MCIEKGIKLLVEESRTYPEIQGERAAGGREGWFGEKFLVRRVKKVVGKLLPCLRGLEKENVQCSDVLLCIINELSSDRSEAAQERLAFLFNCFACGIGASSSMLWYKCGSGKPAWRDFTCSDTPGGSGPGWGQNELQGCFKGTLAPGELTRLGTAAAFVKHGLWYT